MQRCGKQSPYDVRARALELWAKRRRGHPLSRVMSGERRRTRPGDVRSGLGATRSRRVLVSSVLRRGADSGVLQGRWVWMTPLGAPVEPDCRTVRRLVDCPHLKEFVEQRPDWCVEGSPAPRRRPKSC